MHNLCFVTWSRRLPVVNFLNMLRRYIAWPPWQQEHCLTPSAEAELDFGNVFAEGVPLVIPVDNNDRAQGIGLFLWARVSVFTRP